MSTWYITDRKTGSRRAVDLSDEYTDEDVARAVGADSSTYDIRRVGASEQRAINEARLQRQWKKPSSVAEYITPESVRSMEAGRQPSFADRASDALTLAPRYALGIPLGSVMYGLGLKNQGTPQPRSLAESIEQQLAGKNMMTNDPTLVPSVIGGGVGGKIAYRIGSEALVPWLTTLGSATGGSAGYEASQEDPNMGRFATNTAIGSALGALGEVPRKMGVQGAKSAIFTGVGAKVTPGTEQYTERMLQEGIVPYSGGLSQFYDNLNKKLSDLANARSSNSTPNAKINVGTAISEAKNDLDKASFERMITESKANQGKKILNDILEQVSKSKGATKNKSGDVFVSLADMQSVRGLLAEAAKYEKGSQYIPGSAEGARAGMKQILAAEERRSPEWRAGTAAMKPYAAMADATALQMGRPDSRQPLGMRNAIGAGMGTMMLSPLGYMVGGSPGGASGALAGITIGAALGQAQNTLGGSRAMYDLGRLMEIGSGVSPSILRDLSKAEGQEDE